MCRTCAGFFMSTGVVITKIMTYFQKSAQVGRSGDLRSVGGTIGSRPIAAGWLASCSSVGRCSHVAGESQSDWPCVFNNVGRWPQRAGCSPKSEDKSSCSGPTGRNSLSLIICSIIQNVIITGRYNVVIIVTYHWPRVRLNERWISSKTWCVSLDLNVTMSWAWCCWSRSMRMTFNLTSAWMSSNDTCSNSDDRSTVCSRAE